MSKAFTKDDAEDAPLVVPPRAPLPAGIPNYVTPAGLEGLRAELRALEAARASLDPEALAGDRVRARAVITGRIQDLEARIASAEPVFPASQPQDEVRFGARVTVRDEAGSERTYQIVGVDEADVAHGRVAFVAPLARALLGKRVGDVAEVHTPHGAEELEVREIAYDAAQ